MSQSRISPTTEEEIRECRTELEELADSDLPAAPIGSALLDLLE